MHIRLSDVHPLPTIQSPIEGGNGGGVEINIISLRHLKANEKAGGRLKDLNDLENLP